MNSLLEDLKQKIEEIEITYDYEETYSNLYNVCIDYMNELQEWDFEYLFDDIVTYYDAEERAKWELEQGGLLRVYYFLGDANLNNNIFRINAYGNLEDIHKEDLEDLKEEIISIIDEKMKENE